VGFCDDVVFCAVGDGGDGVMGGRGSKWVSLYGWSAWVLLCVFLNLFITLQFCSVQVLRRSP
jgi:hypothetical protein